MGRIDKVSAIDLVEMLYLIIQKIEKEKGKQQQQVAKVDSSNFTQNFAAVTLLLVSY